jgi:hypothetical protein
MNDRIKEIIAVISPPKKAKSKDKDKPKSATSGGPKVIGKKPNQVIASGPPLFSTTSVMHLLAAMFESDEERMEHHSALADNHTFRALVMESCLRHLVELEAKSSLLFKAFRREAVPALFRYWIDPLFGAPSLVRKEKAADGTAKSPLLIACECFDVCIQSHSKSG